MGHLPAAHVRKAAFWAKARDFNAGDPGLYYLRARYYDPTIGRFMSQDPLPAGNPYAYVGNNPVRYVDPSGKTQVVNMPAPSLCRPEVSADARL